MKIYTGTISMKDLKLKSSGTYYARQKQLFVLVVIIVSVLPLLIISWTASHYYKKSWLEKTSAELAGLVDSRKEIIDLFLDNQENMLFSFVKLYSVDHLSDQKNLEKLFLAMDRSGVMVDLGVIDSKGKHLAYTGPYQRQLTGKNYSEAAWFIEVMRSGRYISDVFTGYRNEPHFVVAVADPGKTWILRATINSELFNSLLASAGVGPGGDAYIINRAGEFQTPSLLGEKALSAVERTQVTAKDKALVRITDKYIYAAAPINNGDWTLVLKTDINTSLSEFYLARRRDILIILFASLIILVVSTLIVRSMVNKIEDADKKRMALNNRMLQVEKMALVGRLAASVAHEINNPLQIITNQAGWVDELLEEEDQGLLKNIDEYRDSIKKIRENVKRAGVITRRLLGFSRANDFEKTETDINHLIEETAALLANEASAHRITFRYFLEQGLTRVVTDASQLQQVFLNILDNAIDAIGQDGTISITTRINGNQLVAEFKDTGPGLSPDAIKKLFDPFYTTKEIGKGTGLGLSISFSIMQRLGGDIKAENGKEGGSVFTVMLPMQ
ncbi:MAG: sensor histidine kinase [Nitrospirae bacterium]|nr:MAG: sensor histidine kinase [Nitrospirota bacterium]